MVWLDRDKTGFSNLEQLLFGILKLSFTDVLQKGCSFLCLNGHPSPESIPYTVNVCFLQKVASSICGIWQAVANILRLRRTNVCSRQYPQTLCDEVVKKFITAS